MSKHKPPRTPDTPKPPEGRKGEPASRPKVSGPASPVQEWNSERPAKPLDLDSQLSALLGLRQKEMDNDLVLFDPLTDRAFHLNSTAAFIWRRVIESGPLVKIAQQLAHTYRLEATDAQQITLQFARELLSAGLVVPLDQTRQSS